MRAQIISLLFLVACSSSGDSRAFDNAIVIERAASDETREDIGVHAWRLSLIAQHTASLVAIGETGTSVADATIELTDEEWLAEVNGRWQGVIAIERSGVVRQDTIGEITLFEYGSRDLDDGFRMGGAMGGAAGAAAACMKAPIAVPMPGGLALDTLAKFVACAGAALGGAMGGAMGGASASTSAGGGPGGGDGTMSGGQDTEGSGSGGYGETEGGSGGASETGGGSGSGGYGTSGGYGGSGSGGYATSGYGGSGGYGSDG